MVNLIHEASRQHPQSNSRPTPAADQLYRDQNVFFVGGELPVYETLETMFASYCTEATALFFLTFGSRETFLQGEEMARQIKKNFTVRLMASLDFPLDAVTVERVYAAGVDNLIVPVPRQLTVHHQLPSPLQTARGIFPRWGIATTLVLGNDEPALTINRIDALLQAGIVPLLQIAEPSVRLLQAETTAILENLIASWKRNSVPFSAYLPLLTVMTNQANAKPVGIFRGFFDRLRDRHHVTGSDIRRHLRVQPAENSLDSAGL